jgi:predicted nucleic acid-binding protein
VVLGDVRLYLDACVIQRPLDRLQSSLERAEAECTLLILEAARRGQVELLWSDVLDFECIEQMPPEQSARKAWAEAVRSLAGAVEPLTPAVFARRDELTSRARFSAIDALHVATADVARATLVSVDRRLLRRCTRAGAAAEHVLDVAARLLAK